MTGIEACLIIIGVVMIFASFFVSEKLSAKEIDHLAGLTKDEMSQMLDTELKNSESRIQDTIDEKIEESVVKVSRDMEKVSNDKVMSISEFSDTVMDGINKNHSEVMFLYDMLLDKEEKLKELIAKANALETEAKNREAFAQLPAEQPTLPAEEEAPKAKSEKKSQVKQEEVIDDSEAIRAFFMDPAPEVQAPSMDAAEADDRNAMILEQYHQGKSVVRIAKELGLGQGEVKLVIDLYEGGNR